MTDRTRCFFRSWRVHPFLLMTSVFLPILYGLSLRYSQTTMGNMVISLKGGFRTRGVQHRPCALLLMFTTAYPFVPILFTRMGRHEFRSLLMRGQDFVDLWNMVRFDLGKHARHPRFGRYGYRKKFPYRAFARVILVMIFSGLVLGFHHCFFRFLPRVLIDVTIAIHSWTGTLWFLFLALCHFYLVHLAPGNLPWTGSFCRGEIAAQWLRKFNWLSYEELQRRSRW